MAPPIVGTAEEVRILAEPAQGNANVPFLAPSAALALVQSSEQMAALGRMFREGKGPGQKNRKENAGKRK